MGVPCYLCIHVLNLQKAQALQFSCVDGKRKRRPGEAEQPRSRGERGRTGPGSGARISHWDPALLLCAHDAVHNQRIFFF